MNLKYTYRKSLNLTGDEHDFIFNESKHFGEVEINTYNSRFGAIDIVPYFETTLSFITLTYIQAFAKGFFGEDWFKNLGENYRKELETEMIQAKTFIKAYYNVFVKKNDNLLEAILITETIGDVTLYVVINHYKITDELLDKLPQALVDTYGKISLGYIDIESKSCQLFPDFEKNEWRYLLNPTFQGYGNFVDQYFDLKENKQYKFNSKIDFLKKFNLDEEDKYKLIINALIDR